MSTTCFHMLEQVDIELKSIYSTTCFHMLEQVDIELKSIYSNSLEFNCIQCGF